MNPRDYQKKFVNDIIRKLGEGFTRICAQMSTGSGKTISFAYFLSRYLAKYPSHSIIILVHREELKNQTEKTLKEIGIINVTVSMVKTFVNRAKKDLKHYDMILIDEAHMGDHKRVFDYYSDNIIIGFTATPLSSTKKDPLKNYYQTIVQGIGIKDLIKQGFLCPPIHYSAKNGVDKKSLKKSGGDYTLDSLAMEYSKPKLIDAVVDAYEKYSKGKKTIIFNTTIEHARLVDIAFKERGYNSRSLNEEDRRQSLDWLKDTPDAILNNVSILTTGFDETSIETVIFNRCTKSLSLWLQCCGRGARLHPGKEYFTIIDMGDNIKGESHDYWNAPHDWIYRFTYPEIPGEGAPPMKECPNCEATIYMASTKCPHCDHLMPRETVYSDMAAELNLLPEYELKKNSTIALEKAIIETSQKVRKLHTPNEDKYELLKQSIIAIYDRSSFQLTKYVLKHLLDIYGSEYSTLSTR